MDATTAGGRRRSHEAEASEHRRASPRDLPTVARGDARGGGGRFEKGSPGGRWKRERRGVHHGQGETVGRGIGDSRVPASNPPPPPRAVRAKAPRASGTSPFPTTRQVPPQLTTHGARCPTDPPPGRRPATPRTPPCGKRPSSSPECVRPPSRRVCPARGLRSASCDNGRRAIRSVARAIPRWSAPRGRRP